MLRPPAPCERAAISDRAARSGRAIAGSGVRADPAPDPTGAAPPLEIVGVARVGRHNFTPQRRNNVRYQVLDTVSLERGRHLLKARHRLQPRRQPRSEPAAEFRRSVLLRRARTPLAAAFGLPGPVSAMQAFALGLPVGVRAGIRRSRSRRIDSSMRRCSFRTSGGRKTR